jgi:tetratricopeptide (TPR) repeat protein
VFEWGFQDEDGLLAEAYIIEKIDKNYSKAIELYEQVLSETPGYRLSDIHINIARCYRLLNNHKEAINKLNEVVNSTLYYNVDANYEFSMIYKEKGNIKKATNHIDLMLEHYKHADLTLIKVNRAKALKEELDKL